MVSVIIPTYNRESSIEASIQSVLNQTYSDFELIIVDDDSDDNTRGVVESIDDDRLRYLKLNRNSGVAAARNAGICISQGEYIAFNDSDDIWHKEKLELQINEMLSDSEIMLVYCALERKHLNGYLERIPNKSIPLEYLRGKIIEQLLNENVISTQTMLIRKECIDKVGLFDEKSRLFDDYEFALRVAEQFKIGYVDEVLVDVTLSNDSISIISNDYEEYIKATTNLLYKWSIAGMYAKIANAVQEMSLEQVKVFCDPLKELDSDDLVRIIKEIRNKEEKFLSKDKIMRELVERDTDKVAEYLKIQSFYNVGIYGNGYIGRAIRENVIRHGVGVECIIDRGINNSSSNYKVVCNKDIPEDIDAIILSVYDDDGTIIRNVLEECGGRFPVYTITEILYGE